VLLRRDLDGWVKFHDKIVHRRGQFLNVRRFSLEVLFDRVNSSRASDRSFFTGS
jgi:hypothetical protein